MVEADGEKAEQALSDVSYTEVPSDYFDRLLDALHALSQAIPALRRAAEGRAVNPIFEQAQPPCSCRSAARSPTEPRGASPAATRSSTNGWRLRGLRRSCPGVLPGGGGPPGQNRKNPNGAQP